MKHLIPVLAVLAALAITCATSARFGFRLPISLPKLPPVLRISCSSVLVRLRPASFPHCCSPHCCTPGPFRFDRAEDSPTCPSGRHYVLRRKTCPGKPATKTICEPTIAEKAKNFVKQLNLGDNSGNVPLVTKARKVLKSNATRTLVVKGRHQRSLSVPCPSNRGEKAICQGILSDSCRRGRRSAESLQRESTLLADLVQAQHHFYSTDPTTAGGRERRSSLPAIERNVIFVVDSSGSIGASTYAKVLNVLATFSTLFCGDASIGLVTFATGIDLEFCPTCLRNLDESEYRTEIADSIKAARYHRGWTKTGETVKCLSEEILPSADCRITSKPTQLVFFTDGRANGCTKVPDALAALTARYPTLETYAIGMGNIAQSGITDLLSNAFDPNNVFNVNTITELEDLLTQIKALIVGNSLECSPVTFG